MGQNKYKYLIKTKLFRMYQIKLIQTVVKSNSDTKTIILNSIQN